MRAIVTLTGPSCAGKSTLEGQLKDLGFRSVVSATTRQPRNGEVDGESYYFLTNEQFDKHLAAGEFIENVEFGGNRYGVLATECERVFQDGSPLVVVVEPDGRRQITEYAKKHGWALMKVFVDGTQEVIAERFLNRFALEFAGSNDVHHIQKVIRTASSRLATMTKQEQSWRMEANFSLLLNNGVYDLVIPEFTPDTQSDVVAKIMAVASRWKVEEMENQAA